jgi:glutamate dehydrogenase
MQQRFATAIDEHRLRGEIVATKLANRMVNRLGVLHPFELAEEEGASMTDIAAMFVVAERLFCLPRSGKRSRRPRSAKARASPCSTRVAVAVRGQVADLLRVCRPGASPAEVIARLKPGIDALDKQAKALLLDEVKRAERAHLGQARSRRRAARIRRQGDPAVRAGRRGRPRRSRRAQGVDETVLTRAFTRSARRSASTGRSRPRRASPPAIRGSGCSSPASPATSSSSASNSSAARRDGSRRRRSKPGSREPPPASPSSPIW